MPSMGVDLLITTMKTTVAVKMFINSIISLTFWMRTALRKTIVNNNDQGLLSQTFYQIQIKFKTSLRRHKENIAEKTIFLFSQEFRE